MYNKNTNGLKEIRIEKNITISELAAKLKVTNNLIVKWESGMDYIPLKYLIALSKILDVSVEKILYGEHREPLILDNLSDNQLNIILNLYKEFTNDGNE